jgi:hypothetical protein
MDGRRAILGIRAQGHAAPIRLGRWETLAMGGAAPCPTVRVMLVTGWKTGRKGEMGKGLTGGPHMAARQGDG